MITVTFTRVREDYKKSMGAKYKPSIQHFHESIEGALLRLISMGDRIIDLSQTEIKTFGVTGPCEDTDVYTGTEEEMKDLVATAYFMATIQQSPDFFEKMNQESEAMLGDKSNNPMLLNFALPILHQRATTKGAFLMAMKLDESSMKLAEKLSIKDMLAFYSMAKQDGISYSEILKAIA